MYTGGAFVLFTQTQKTEGPVNRAGLLVFTEESLKFYDMPALVLASCLRSGKKLVCSPPSCAPPFPLTYALHISCLYKCHLVSEIIMKTKSKGIKNKKTKNYDSRPALN